MGSAKVATMTLLLALCPLFASATPTIWPMPSSLVDNGATLTVGASTTFFVEKAAVVVVVVVVVVVFSAADRGLYALHEPHLSPRHHLRRYGPGQGQGQ